MSPPSLDGAGPTDAGQAPKLAQPSQGEATLDRGAAPRSVVHAGGCGVGLDVVAVVEDRGRLRLRFGVCGWRVAIYIRRVRNVG